MARPATSPGYGAVRLLKRGRYWYARFPEHGRRREVPLRVTNKVPAEAKARQISDALEQGEPWEWILGRQPEGAWTFAQAVDEYLQSGSRWGPTTRRANGSTLRMLKAEFGPRPLTDIAQADVEGYLARRRDEGLSKASRNRYLCCLKVVLGKAQEWGRVPRNVAAAVKMEPEGRKQPRPFRADEVERLAVVLQPQHQRVMRVYLETGMRRGELVGLLPSDVDFAAGTLAVRHPKNRRDRTIPMSGQVRQILAERLKEWQAERHGPTPDVRLFGEAADIRQVLTRAARRAGIKDGRGGRMQHRLRDTFITRLVEQGVPLDRVQMLAGHNSMEMTRRYAETRPEALQEAIARVFG
ncbi:MAG: site-specific integrase [Candidatus Latescibacterota bacterium]